LLDSYPPDGAWAPGPELVDQVEQAILTTMAADLGLARGDSLRADVARGYGLAERTLSAMAEASANLVRILQTPPETYRGDLHFFTAGQNLASRKGGSERWREHVTGEILDEVIDCDHFELMRPGPVSTIGTRISPRLVP
jgi:nonribosomal peptide synthetase DhbF